MNATNRDWADEAAVALDDYIFSNWPETDAVDVMANIIRRHHDAECKMSPAEQATAARLIRQGMDVTRLVEASGRTEKAITQLACVLATGSQDRFDEFMRGGALSHAYDGLKLALRPFTKQENDDAE